MLWKSIKKPVIRSQCIIRTEGGRRKTRDGLDGRMEKEGEEEYEHPNEGMEKKGRLRDFRGRYLKMPQRKLIYKTLKDFSNTYTYRKRSYLCRLDTALK